MGRKTFCRLPVLLVLCFIALSCQGKDPGTAPGRLVVVTTLFPLYDFAKNVAGERANVSLLLPPGIEPHGFEPKPTDIIRLNAADLFIYTSPDMEPWAQLLIRGVQSGKLEVIQAGAGIVAEENHPADVHRHEHGNKAGSNGHDTVDPHIWLDFGNAAKMVEAIRDGLMKKDPAGRDVYEKNAAAYTARLRELDERYRAALRSCRVRSLISGGHFAFHYLAERYGLGYVSVYGISPDAEPTPASLVRVTREMRRQGAKHLFFEELIDPRVSKAIASETGATLIRLHGAHNLTKEEMERNETFIGIMNENLDHLRTGLECP